MGDLSAFEYRQQLREAEREQLYWQQKALERDADNYTTDEYARALEPILKRRKELDKREQEWKKAMDPLDFTPDADPRKDRDRDAVREAREQNYPAPEPEYGRGKAEKFYGKTPVPYKGAEKEAAAEMDAAMATSSEEGSEEETEDEEEAASPTLDDRRRATFADGSESESKGEDDESESEEGLGSFSSASKREERAAERREKDNLYKNKDKSNVLNNDEELAERDAYLDAYETFVVTRQMAQTRAKLIRLKKSADFYMLQADRAVQSVEACEKATKAVMDAIEDRNASEDDCEKVLARVKERAKTLRSTVAKALNDAYSAEELAAYVEEDRVYVEQQMEEGEDPYARARQFAEQQKLTMFEAIETLMELNGMAFDGEKFAKVREEAENQ
jgi:hypothetical protein